MTDTKIIVSKYGGSMSGVTASYSDTNNAAILKVVAVRTLSTQQDGMIVLLENGITDIGYASEVDGTSYTGTLSSINSSRSDRFYVLEMSNIFGNPDNPTLLTDTHLNLVAPEQEFYSTNHYFRADNFETNPRTFTIDMSMYSGPTNTVQLDFYRLLVDENNEFYKHSVPISFIR